MNSAQNIFSSIAAVNDKAIGLLRHSNDYAGAQVLLDDGLSKICEAFHTNAMAEEDDDNMWEENNNENLMILQEERVCIGATLVALDLPSSYTETSSFVIFRNAISIVHAPSPTVGTQSQTLEHALGLLECAMFFNLGFAHHLQALASGNFQDLDTAADKYDTSLGMLADHEFIERTPFVTLMELALLNNGGQIDSLHFSINKVHRCVYMMRSSLDQLLMSYGVIPLALPRELTLFSMNIFMNMNHYARPSAAA